jgi:hypothetical protein
MMSTTPTAVIRSASPRPYTELLSVSAHPAGSSTDTSLGGTWVCCDHMSTEHNPITGIANGSKRLGPGSFVGVLT